MATSDAHPAPSALNQSTATGTAEAHTSNARSTAGAASSATTGRPAASDAAASSRRDAAQPSSLALTSVVLGVLGAVCALSVVWFVVAVPLAVAAIICALVDRGRRRSRGTTGPAAAATVGLVLGVAVLPMAAGAFVMIPRIEGIAERSAAAVQGGVQDDLHSLERTTTHNVDSLDHTLTELVNETDKGFKDSIHSVERTTTENMHDMERSIRSTVEQADKASAAELEQLEASLREDLRIADARAASIESDLRAEINRLLAEVDQLQSLYEQARNDP